MLLVLTALMMEARPLAAAFGLRARQAPYPVYESDSMRLVVSGTGPLRASAATGWAMGEDPSIEAAVNIGFCGAAPEIASLHQWCLVHAIRDKQTGRLLVPDILYRHPFHEAPLMTVPQVVQEPINWNGLVDMEGAGFFEAARHHLATDRLMLLKWVSDPLTGRIDVEKTTSAFEAGLEPVANFVRAWMETFNTASDAPGEDLLDLCQERLRLTSTQWAFIKKWLRGYALRGGTAEALLKYLPEEKPPTRKQNTHHFSLLRDALKR